MGLRVGGLGLFRSSYADLGDVYRVVPVVAFSVFGVQCRKNLPDMVVGRMT